MRLCRTYIVSSELRHHVREHGIVAVVVGPGAGKVFRQRRAAADVVDVKQLPSHRLARLAAAADLIAAQCIMTLAVDAVDVRLHGAHVAAVVEAQQLPILAGGPDVHQSARYSSPRNCFRIASFSSVDVSWVISSPRAMVRRSRRMILPERVFGRLSA